MSRALRENGIEEVLVHTGQHFDAGMSKVFFDELSIPQPAYYLGLGGGSHGEMTGRMLENVEKLLFKEKPDWVIVFGDTNSTLAGALAASKLHIPVCHVEAGLRSYNRRMPEEQNRVLTDHLSSLLGCSSEVGVANLEREGIFEGVRVVGDVMGDASNLARQIISGSSDSSLSQEFPDDFLLLTLHRADNTDDVDRLRKLVRQVNQCGLPVVLPAHPRLSKLLVENKLDFEDNVSPVSYTHLTLPTTPYV